MVRPTQPFLIAALTATVLAACSSGRAPAAPASPQPPEAVSSPAKSVIPPTPDPSSDPSAAPSPPAIPATPVLDKLPATPALPGPLLVMVENSPDARPQAGLDQADVVYEIVAEGGLSRFLAVFGQPAERIGPVRSARRYYMDIARAYDSPYAHCGASPDAEALARDGYVQSMDEIYGSGAWFRRSSDREPPHNLYTSTELLLAGAQAQGMHLGTMPTMPTVAGTPKGDAAPAGVKLTFPGGWNQVRYTYKNGVYARFHGDDPHMMESGRQVAPANVVVLYARHHYRGDEEGRLDVAVIGEGDALFLSQGQVLHGHWQKSSADAHFQFTAAGRPVLFAPGPTWIEVLPSADHVELLPP